MNPRFLTGGLLLFLGILLISLGEFPFLIFVYFVTIFSASEIMAMLLPKKRGYLILIIGILSATFLSLVPIALNLPSLANSIFQIWRSFPLRVLVVFFITFFILELVLRSLFIPKNNFLKALRAIIFLLATFPFIFLLRAGHNGLINMWFCCLIIWSDDMFAYFGGLKFGKHKLTAISPKKTIEGAVIGTIGSMISAFLLIWYFRLDLYLYLVLALIISLLAQFGDLHESLFKRYFKIKDSSNLLPGHGGFYDRADSTLFVMPLMFFFFN